MIPQTTFVLTFRPHIISELGGVNIQSKTNRKLEISNLEKLPTILWKNAPKQTAICLKKCVEKKVVRAWLLYALLDLRYLRKRQKQIDSSRVSNIESDNSQNVGLEDYNNISDRIFPHFTTPSIKICLGQKEFEDSFRF